MNIKWFLLTLICLSLPSLSAHKPKVYVAHLAYVSANQVKNTLKKQFPYLEKALVVAQERLGHGSESLEALGHYNTDRSENYIMISGCLTQQELSEIQSFIQKIDTPCLK